MSDPVRLRDGGDAFEALLVDSVSDEVAGPRVAARVHAALGLGAAIGVASTASTAAAGVATKSTSAIATLAVAKWVGVVVIAGVALGKASVYIVPPRSNAAQALPVDATGARAGHSSPQAGELTRTPPRAPAEGAPVSAPASTATTATPDVVPSRPMPGSAPSTSPATLLAELSPIDAARAALDAGNTTLALEQLNRHDLDYPHGQLAPEALALRIEVYAARHDDAKVLELSRHFLALYPDHPQAARVRATESRVGR